MVCLAELAWSDLPPLCVEIGPEHPLLIFQDSGRDCTDAATYAQHVVQAWRDLSEDLRPFAAMQIEARGNDGTARHQWFRGMLVPLQDADVPVVIRIGDGDLHRFHPLDRAEELVREFTCVKGIQVVNLPFEDYGEFGADSPLGTSPAVRWLVDAIDLAARYGRFIVIELDQIRWPRMMANAACAPLYQKMRECAGYVTPIAECRGPHTIPQMAALLGLWLEGAVAQWGVGPQSTWYSDAHFVEPGVFGVSEQPTKMPPALYRAMIADGAMIGASVYSFATDTDLWFGVARHHWDEAIGPTLRELLDLRLIARQDFVRKKVRLAYQLAPAHTPQDFHLNLRDIDGVLDQGLLMRGAYGMERPGQMPELIPNTGRHYWVPLISAFATEAVSPLFESVVKPGLQTSAEAWTELLDRYYQPDGEGTAFITSIGRGIFIMNSCENRIEPQTFRVAAVAAPVRQFQANRQDNGVLITWPFREGDLSYRVYKRVLPETRRTILANGIEERRYLDTTADSNQTIAYAVAALTEDKEPYEGVVNYGEYLLLSAVESRVAEEVVIGPLLGLAQSKPVEPPAPPQPAPLPWWPNLTGLSDTQLPAATEIVKRIEDWDRFFRGKDLNGVLGLYAAEYEDPQGWRLQYVRRAYQWFFEHYGACAMHRQIRHWDFSGQAASGQVGVLLYCRFAGYAVSDPTGRTADLPAWFPRAGNGEVWVYFANQDGQWRIVRTNPALPNFKDILSFSASPYDNLPLGPDQQGGKSQ
jgi:hypothetical protein